MKKEYLVHVVWVLLAGGAFALGKFTASPGPGSDDKKRAAGPSSGGSSCSVVALRVPFRFRRFLRQ